MQFPTALHQNFFAQAITVTGSPAGMIRFAVALDAQRKKSGVGRMLDGQINIISRDTDLAFGLETGAL